MYCKNCGRFMEEGRIICPDCGWSKTGSGKPGYTNPGTHAGTASSGDDYGKKIGSIAKTITALAIILSIVAVIAINMYDDDFIVISIFAEIGIILVLTIIYIFTMGFAQLVSDTREIKESIRSLNGSSSETNAYLNHFTKDGVNVYVVDDDDNDNDSD